MIREMKNSGVEWLGIIPQSWEVKKGKFLFRQRSEKGNYKELQLLSPTQKYGVVPQSLYEKLSGMKAVKLNEDADLAEFKSIYSGDFCISLRSFQGGFEYSTYNGVVSPAYQVFYKITKDVFDRFYKYMFKEQSFIAYMTSFTKTFRDGKSIAFADFANSLLPVPVWDEQKRIAEFLDQQCCEIDIVIEKTKSTIEEYKKLKGAIITEAVTKGVRTGKILKESGVEWIGEIPSDWYVSPLKYHVELNKSSLGEDTSDDFEFDYVEIGAVTLENGIFEYQHLKFSDAPSRARRIVQPNDIIISTVRTYLKAIAVVPDKENIVVSTGFAVLTPRNINIDFLGFALKSEYFVQMVTANSVGISYPAINSSDLVKFKIAIPTIEEQEEIVKFLSKRCADIDTLIVKKINLLAEMEAYKKSVIYEYVTGKREVL